MLNAGDQAVNREIHFLSTWWFHSSEERQILNKHIAKIITCYVKCSAGNRWDALMENKRNELLSIGLSGKEFLRSSHLHRAQPYLPCLDDLLCVGHVIRNCQILYSIRSFQVCHVLSTFQIRKQRLKEVMVDSVDSCLTSPHPFSEQLCQCGSF